MDSIAARLQWNSTSFNLPTHSRLQFTNPISSSSIISFKSLKLKTPFKPLNSSPLHLPQPISQTPNPQPQNALFTILKTTCITLVTTTLFLTHLTKPSLASQPPATTQSPQQEETLDTDEEKERVYEDYLQSNPDDARALKGLMEVKIKTRKFDQAVDIINRLIALEPFEKEWPLMKAHVCNYSGDIDSARLGFEEILSKDPLLVEAYHGLVMVASQSDDEMEGVVRRIVSAVEKCKKEKRKEELRDFKLLLAQVRVVEGKYVDALKVYQELVKEEPRDFRPYLCQGIIYTLLKKPKEAEAQFEKYRRLVPKEHPYARYFEDNMNATKMFSQMAESR